MADELLESQRLTPNLESISGRIGLSGLWLNRVKTTAVPPCSTYEKTAGKETIFSSLNDYADYEDYVSACEYPAIWYAGGHYGLVVNMVTGEVGS